VCCCGYRLGLTGDADVLGHGVDQLRHGALAAVLARDGQDVEAAVARRELLGVADAPQRPVHEDAQPVAQSLCPPASASAFFFALTFFAAAAVVAGNAMATVGNGSK
jgi:hypothetical protein